jgi:hypothetical protein
VTSRVNLTISIGRIRFRFVLYPFPFRTVLLGRTTTKRYYIPRLHATMPRSKKPGWVNWQSCSARAIILEDLLPGGPLFQRDNVPAAAILEWYKDKHPNQFDGIVLEQFAARLKDHRKQGLEEYATAQEEEKYFAHDRKLYPSRSKSHPQS